MVFHANTHAHAAPPHGVAANYQSPNAVADLDAMRVNARADYAGLHLHTKASLGKDAYYQAAAQAEQRTTDQGRTLTYDQGGNRCNRSSTADIRSSASSRAAAGGSIIRPEAGSTTTGLRAM